MSQADIVRPTIWTMARLQAEPLDDLQAQMRETQARSNTITAELVGLVAASQEALDSLARLRLGRWVLRTD